MNILPDRRILLFAALALALPGALPGQVPSAAGGDVVWHWFGECAGRDSMALEVRFDNESVYSSTFPICQVRRDHIKHEPQQRFLTFHFRAVPRRFRAHEPGTEPEPITGTVWETGGERNAIQLGISFATEQLVLLNVHHLALAQSSSRSERVRGLAITTRPVRHKP